MSYEEYWWISRPPSRRVWITPQADFRTALITPEELKQASQAYDSEVSDIQLSNMLVQAVDYPESFIRAPILSKEVVDYYTKISSTLQLSVRAPSSQLALKVTDFENKASTESPRPSTIVVKLSLIHI